MPGKIEKANLQPTHKCSFCGIDDKSLKVSDDCRARGVDLQRLREIVRRHCV